MFTHFLDLIGLIVLLYMGHKLSSVGISTDQMKIKTVQFL